MELGNASAGEWSDFSPNSKHTMDSASIYFENNAMLFFVNA